MGRTEEKLYATFLNLWTFAKRVRNNYTYINNKSPQINPEIQESLYKYSHTFSCVNYVDFIFILTNEITAVMVLCGTERGMYVKYFMLNVLSYLSVIKA